MKTLDFLLFGILLVISTAMTARESNAGTASVQIPGSIKTSPIEFAPNLDLEPRRAFLVAKSPPGTEGETKQGLVLTETSGKTLVSTGPWYPLQNPRVITTVGTPIPLEAKVSLNEESRSSEAKAGELVPDSVAAWKRLKTWPAAKKGISAKTIAEIDASAEEVKRSVQKIIEAGKLEKEDGEELLRKYESFSRQLGVAFDDSTDLDLKRQLSAAISGVRAERLAWLKSLTTSYPVLNPKYSAELTLPSDTPGPKVLGETGVPNRYQGYEKLQLQRPTLQYKKMYEQARATVAICEGGGLAFASGTIIGKDLILTCAHGVARSGHGGKPAARDPKNLWVKIGYDFPQDLNTPETSIQAKIIYEGQIAEEEADPLDFVLLKVEIGNYETKRFEKAENESRGIRESNKTEEVKRLELKEAAFWPIEPLPLANYDVTETDEFIIAGHPEGHAKLICDNGKILYPLWMPADKRDELYKALYNPNAATKEEAAKFEILFRSMYLLKTKGNNEKYYRYTYDNNSPGIGVICSTMSGNSGGSAVAKGVEPACIIGILVEGQPGRSVPWIAGVERHEKLLPTTAIIKHLDANFKAEKPGQEFKVPWYKQYSVKIMDQALDGTLIPRP